MAHTTMERVIATLLAACKRIDAGVADNAAFLAEVEELPEVRAYRQELTSKEELQRAEMEARWARERVIDSDLVERANRKAQECGAAVYDEVAALVANYENCLLMAGDEPTERVTPWHLAEFAKWAEGYRRILEAFCITGDLTVAEMRVAENPDREAYNLEKSVCQVDVVDAKGVVKATFTGERTGCGCFVSETYFGLPGSKGKGKRVGSSGLPMSASGEEIQDYAERLAQAFAKVNGYERVVTIPWWVDTLR